MIAMMRSVGFLCLWLVVYQVKGSYIPAEMNRTIQGLLKHYKIPGKQIFDGKPVFPREAPAGTTEEKMVYMSNILDIYERMFDHMLKQLPTPSPKLAAITGHQAATGSANDVPTGAGGDIKKQLTYIRNKMRELKKHHYQKQDQFLQKLYTDRHIKLDDSVIQNKALWELPGLYQQASSLGANGTMRQRRRRQAMRKNPLRG